MATSQYDVFLCYNSEDREKVIDIAQKLKGNDIKLKPWLDVWELPPGDLWKPIIQQQIAQIKSAAVFIGKSKTGPWQNAEIEELLSKFEKRKCPVIPVLLHDVPEDFDFEQLKLPKSLKRETFLQDINRVDFRKQQTGDSTEDPMDQLVWGITRQKVDKIDGGGKYTEKKVIERGFFTNVYKYKNTSLDQDVVIKQLHHDSIKDKFKTSIKDAFTISNFSNFITIYDYCEYPKKHPFYVMQYVEGESLRKKLDRKEDPIKWQGNSDKIWIKVVLEIVLNIGNAIIKAREKLNSSNSNYYHFNLKPSNIILDNKNEPFISAFNLCVSFEKEERIKELERLKKENSNEGKLNEELAYLLPEKFIKTYNENGDKADQYMLGLLAYELITGKTPPSIQDFETLKNDDCKEAFPKIAFPESFFKDDKYPNFPSNYKTLIENVIPKMIALNPDERYESLEEVLAIIRIQNTYNKEIETIKIVKKSYKKCLENTKSKDYLSFFEGFYEDFRKHSEVEQKFSNGKFDSKDFWMNHHKKVEQTILLFFWYYEEKMIFKLEPTTDEAFNPLNYIIVHSHANIDISENLFDFFKTTLIDNVIKHDDTCNEESYKTLIRSAWEKVLEPGFKYIKSKSQKRDQNLSGNIPITPTIPHSIS